MKDERKHSRIQLPVSREQVDAYKEKLKALNAAPIKKVAEAKARKKRKVGGPGNPRQEYCQVFNTLRPRQNGRHFSDDIFKCIFLDEDL